MIKLLMKGCQVPANSQHVKALKLLSDTLLVVGSRFRVDVFHVNACGNSSSFIHECVRKLVAAKSLCAGIRFLVPYPIFSRVSHPKVFAF
jgi:hypothetical protein